MYNATLIVVGAMHMHPPIKIIDFVVGENGSNKVTSSWIFSALRP